MEEIWKAVGGLPGVFALVVAATAVFWRFKFPQIGIEYLKQQLDLHREEIRIADIDRRKLRDEVKGVKEEMFGLESRYMECLQDKENIAHELRQTRRQLAEERGQMREDRSQIREDRSQLREERDQLREEREKPRRPEIGQ